MEQAQSAGNTYASPSRVVSHSIRYEGLGAETLGLMLRAPSSPGMYRIGYIQDGGLSEESFCEFIVQET